MDDETRAAILEVRSEVRFAVMCLTQALAVLVGDDPAKRSVLDEAITRFEGMAKSAGARTIMSIMREAHDRTAASMRTMFPDDAPLQD
mgnify:CR=1 FL=1